MQPSTLLDRKGLIAYLAITFVITYTIEGLLIGSGFRIAGLPPMYGQLVVAGVMWVPALATFVTIRFITHEGFAITNLRFGSWKPYVTSALVVPAVFAVTYGITWLLGLGVPDWQLAHFRGLFSSVGAPVPEDFNPVRTLLIVFLVTVFVAPAINGIFGFGEEFGWRGYLLPKLMPLGRVRAYIGVGVIWGLWHAPLVLVGFNYPGYPILGIIAMCGLTTSMGIYINEMTLRHRSSILAGWIHGAINSQGYGIWGALLFPTVNPLLGGLTGLIGMGVWLAVGLWVARRPGMPEISQLYESPMRATSG